jgi:replicative DNA helicase
MADETIPPPTDADAPDEFGGQEPLHDVPAEQSTLGAMMLSRDGTEVDEVMATLEPADFWLPKHETIALAIGRLRTADKPTDVIAVTDELSRTGDLSRAGEAHYLHELTSATPTVASAGFYAGVVKDRAVRRRLVEASVRLAAMGNSSEGDLSDLVARAIAEVESIYVPSVRSIRPIGEGLPDLAVSLEEKPQYIPTAWSSLDVEVGGFAKGELIIIAARPGDGKSILLQQAAMKAARVGHVAYISLEMSEVELQKRMVANYGEINMTALRNHTLSQQDWNRFGDAIKQVTGAPVYVRDEPAATISSIRAHAHAVARRGPLAMVVVDYLQLVDGPGSDRRTIVDGVSRDLKRLAKSLNVPVLAAAQLNRGERSRAGSRPEPTLRDLREAGGIEQDADCVLLLHRTEKLQSEVAVIIAKNRHGGLGKVRLSWQPHYARVLDRGWSAFEDLLDGKGEA